MQPQQKLQPAKSYPGTLAVVPQESRALPQQQAAEEALLGALLLDGAAIVLIQEDLPIQAFYQPHHQFLYQTLLELHQQGHPLDVVALVEYLQEQQQLQQVGGAYQLVELTHSVASSANIEQHATLVLGAFRRRQLITWATTTIQEAYRLDRDVLALLDNTREQLLELSHHSTAPNLLPLLNESLAQLEQSSVHPTLRAVPTGFEQLDDYTGGWQPSDLIILAARPSMGKTALALQLAHQAAQAGFPVAIFSLEMSALQLITRIIKQQAGVPKQELHTTTGRAQIRAYASILKGLPIHIDDTAALNTTQLRARCKKLHAQGKLKLILIDYLQLMTSPAEQQQREQEIAAISRALKALAKELNVPVIALSQLSRACEQRADKRPQLADLRESGSLEQDADIVLFLNRLEQYGILEDEEGHSTLGKGELIVAKHRNGAIGLVSLEWFGEGMRFG